MTLVAASRTILLVLVLHGCLRATPVAAGSVVSVEDVDNQRAIERLMPSSSFSLGMSVDDLEPLIGSLFQDWTRAERKRAFNNRKDVELSAEAQSEYLQTVSISHEAKDRGVTIGYNFALTSPLSGSRVYSIVYSVETKGSGIIAIDDWISGLRQRWGEPYGGLSDSRARATYFFNKDGRSAERAGDPCPPIHPAFFRLDEKTPEQVAVVSTLVNSTQCAQTRDSILAIKNGVVLRSTFFVVDFGLQVNDVLKRVAFGIR